MAPTSNWRPSATREALVSRAVHIQHIRQYFQQHDVLEVTTPVLSSFAASDVNLEQWRTSNGYALHTSPEYAMKRLLADGYGDIFQICQVFRCDELSVRHNPEFTMLEWYRVGWDEQQLMDEVTRLIEALLGRTLGVEKLSYRDCFVLNALPDAFQASDQELRAAVASRLCSDARHWNRDDCLNALMAMVVEPNLATDRLVYVHGFPPSQAALANVGEHQGVLVGRRFELYWQGLELANGYDELTDAVEQQSRFQADQQQRALLGLAPVELDQNFLAALSAGMPKCAGVAMGLDRLIMLLEGYKAINDVIAFPIDRA